MEHETIEDFAKYRLTRAQETLTTAEWIFKEGKDYTSANNRAYYAIFYAIRAVLALDQKDFKRRADVVAYFNQYYVHTSIFPKQLGRKNAQAQRVREDSDYDEEYSPSYEKTEQQIKTAKELINLVKEYIESKCG